MSECEIHLSFIYVLYLHPEGNFIGYFKILFVYKRKFHGVEFSTGAVMLGL
jgi:hypothetical protein